MGFREVQGFRIEVSAPMSLGLQLTFGFKACFKVQDERVKGFRPKRRGYRLKTGGCRVKALRIPVIPV